MGALMNMLESALDRLARIDVLDDHANRLADAVGSVTHRPRLASALSGTPMGHPLHPALTDLPIGFWTSAFVLDLAGGRSGRRSAQLFVGLGILTALPTAMTGLADWADTEDAPRRIGAVHGLVNSVALASYLLSWTSRRRDHHARGVILGMFGAGAATIGAYLGGHLVSRTGTGVDVNAGQPRPNEWMEARTNEVLASPPEDVRFLIAEGTGVLAARRSDGWTGIGARCSHRGGPLQAGTIEDGCVRCPWHASRFRLEDGSVVNGPATAPQPRFEIRDDGELWFRQQPD
jgi:nitrite reductase/ring-hydroxylating ferredoxin subunit/uncharacterized membrane protein